MRYRFGNMSFFYCFFQKHRNTSLTMCLLMVFAILTGILVYSKENVRGVKTHQKTNIYHLANESLPVDGDVTKKDLEPSGLNAKYALLMDASNGRVLFGFSTPKNLAKVAETFNMLFPQSGLINSFILYPIIILSKQ